MLYVGTHYWTVDKILVSYPTWTMAPVYTRQEAGLGGAILERWPIQGSLTVRVMQILPASPLTMT